MPIPRYIIHIDMNSFFASCEQQANALLRGKPCAVVAYNAPSSVILAASIEAKQCGIKTGTIVRDAQKQCPHIVLLDNDPAKYRAISKKITHVLSYYSDTIEPYSIDESFIDLTGWVRSWEAAREKAQDMKRRIRTEVGDWLRCSIGISSTKFLAKVGSDLHKPDGLTVITPNDLPAIYEGVALTDLWGIAHGWKRRLWRIGIRTIIDLYHYPLQNLISLFGKPGYYLYAHVHGIHILPIQGTEPLPKSISHQYAVPQAHAHPHNLPRLLMKLCEKVGRRMRSHNLLARKIVLYIRFRERGSLHQHHTLPYYIRSTLDLYRHASELVAAQPTVGAIRLIAVGVASFTTPNHQLSFWETHTLRGTPTQIDDAIDAINDKYGSFSIAHGTMWGTNDLMPDRIGFRKRD